MKFPANPKIVSHKITHSYVAGGSWDCMGPSYLTPRNTSQRNQQARYDGSYLIRSHTFRYGFQFVNIPEAIDASLLVAGIPVQVGRLPWSYPHVIRVLNAAARRAGISWIGTHSIRHRFRSWMDSMGTPIALQQKLMRHSDIRTTTNGFLTPLPQRYDRSAEP